MIRLATNFNIVSILSFNINRWRMIVAHIIILYTRLFIVQANFCSASFKPFGTVPVSPAVLGVGESIKHQQCLVTR